MKNKILAVAMLMVVGSVQSYYGHLKIPNGFTGDVIKVDPLSPSEVAVYMNMTPSQQNDYYQVWLKGLASPTEFLLGRYPGGNGGHIAVELKGQGSFASDVMAPTEQLLVVGKAYVTDAEKNLLLNAAMVANSSDKNLANSAVSFLSIFVILALGVEEEYAAEHKVSFEKAAATFLTYLNISEERRGRPSGYPKAIQKGWSLNRPGNSK